jgi:hypothetical protein
MIAIKKSLLPPGVTVFCVGLLLSVSGCGDSTGPSDLDSSEALQSLVLGLGPISESPTSPAMDASFGGIAPVLDQIQVTIDGKSQTMFALGVRESFPLGTCEEKIFGISPALPEPACTPMPDGVAVILWQSHSASAPPDRLIVIFGDIGTSNFDFMASLTSTSEALPASALYMEGEDNVWLSLSGTLTSQVTATSRTCSLPLPPYAKTATCSIATFDEQGSIVFEPFDAFSSIPSTKRLTLTIPRQTLHGLWQAITEIQPIPSIPFIAPFDRTSRLLRF